MAVPIVSRTTMQMRNLRISALFYRDVLRGMYVEVLLTKMQMKARI